MNAETLSEEITKIRKRLAEVEEERANLAEDAFAAKADLMDEEHVLRARLAEIQDSLSGGDDETEELELDRTMPPMHGA